MEQTTSVELGPDLSPRSVRQEGRALGIDTEIRVDYAGGRATGRARTPTREGTVEEREIDVAVPPGVVDDNTLHSLLPALEWGPGAAWVVPVLASGKGTVVASTLRVTGIETVEVPAGTFEAYRVVLERKDGPTAFWVSTGSPRRVVKVASLAAPFEAVLVE